jgi:hypothetical protein
MSVRVTVVVTGPAAQLDGFRRHVNARLDELPKPRYAELHTPERLDYRLTIAGGIPFPTFVATSEEFPEHTVAVAWEGLDGEPSGYATIANGGLVEHSAGPAGPERAPYAVHVSLEPDATIRLAVALRVIEATHTIGYVLSAHAHGLFELARDAAGERLRVSDALEPAWVRCWRVHGDDAVPASVVPPAPIATPLRTQLKAIAESFAAAWIWFDAEAAVDTALERHRYGLYGYAVQPANVKAERIRAIPADSAAAGFLHSTVPADAQRAIRLLERYWHAG